MCEGAAERRGAKAPETEVTRQQRSRPKKEKASSSQSQMNKTYGVRAR